MTIFEKLQSVGIPVPTRLLNKKDLSEDVDDCMTCGMTEPASQKVIDTICFIVSLVTPKKLKLVKLEFYDGTMVEWPMLNQDTYNKADNV